MTSKVLKTLKNLDVEGALDTVGLEKKRSVLGMVLPAVGFLLGGIGIGLLISQRPGKELRGKLAKGAAKVAETAKELRENGLPALGVFESNGHQRARS